MRILRLRFKQPTAHYRVGFTQQHLHRTYPLPPPSTIIGMIHNLMGCRKGEVIRGFDIAVCGKCESVYYQYQLFRNIGKSAEHAYKEAHPGASMPNQVQLLLNVELLIQIKLGDSLSLESDGKIANLKTDEFIKKIIDPQVPFIIGRREDLAILEDIAEIKSAEKSELPDKLYVGHWIEQKDAGSFGLNGPVYLLNTYYQLAGGIRSFRRKRYVYADSQPIPIKRSGGNEKKKFRLREGLVDDEGWKEDDRYLPVPVFFLKIDSGEN